MTEYCISAKINEKWGIWELYTCGQKLSLRTYIVRTYHSYNCARFDRSRFVAFWVAEAAKQGQREIGLHDFKIRVLKPKEEKR